MTYLHRTLPLLFCSVALLSLLVLPDTAQGDWLASDWTKRVELTVRTEHVPPAGSLEGITLVATFDSDHIASIFESANANGSDLVMTAADGVTVLPHELVRFDPVAQSGELWFRADLLSPANRTYYLYFANPAATVSADPTAAWGDEFLAVYHFEEDPSLGVLHDSGPHAHSGSAEEFLADWSPSDLVAGIVGSGWNFDGIDNYVVVENMSSPDSSFTISTWIAESPEYERGSLAFQAVSGFWNTSFQRSGQVPFADLETATGFMTWEPTITDAEMYLYTWVLDGANQNARFFLNGIEQSRRVNYEATPGVPVYGGEQINGRVGIAGPAWFNTLDLAHGTVDEYRIVAGARSPGWIAVEYRNQVDPRQFFDAVVENRPTLTSLDSPSPGHGNRIQAWPNPFRGTTDIGVDGLDGPLPIGVYDAAGRLVRVLRPLSAFDGRVQAQWNGRDERGQLVAKGLYLIRPLESETTAATKVMFLR